MEVVLNFGGKRASESAEELSKNATRPELMATGERGSRGHEAYL